jgi:hypothetical protein
VKASCRSLRSAVRRRKSVPSGAKQAAEKVARRRAWLQPCRSPLCDQKGLQPLRYGFPMIPREFLCDDKYLSAFECCERWPISSGMSQRRTSGAKRIPRGKTSVLPSVAAAKALIAVAFYGTAEPVPFVHGVFPQPVKPDVLASCMYGLKAHTRHPLIRQLGASIHPSLRSECGGR